MAKCVVVQHVEPESAFAIADALHAARVTVDVRRVYAGDPLPFDLSDFDGLVVMGGPMSAATDEGFATRAAEIGLLVDAIDARIPTIGVCLGAQLLALAGGGSVAVGAAGPEIGWIGDVAWGVQFHIEVTEEAVEGFLRAFAAEAAGAPGGPERIRQSTAVALEQLAASRNLAFERFAALVAARFSEVDVVGQG